MIEKTLRTRRKNLLSTAKQILTKVIRPMMTATKTLKSKNRLSYISSRKYTYIKLNKLSRKCAISAKFLDHKGFIMSFVPRY